MARRRRPPPHGHVVVYDGYGTAAGFTLSGRVLQDSGERLPAVGRSPWSNLHDVWRALESDEVPRCDVVATVADVEYAAVTDDNGVFTIDVPRAARELAPGAARAIVQTASPTLVDAAPAEAVVHVLDDRPGIAVVSDFDDTIVETFVAQRRRMFTQVFLKNASQLSPVSGVGTAYRALHEAGSRAFFYLSGSPQNFHPRIRAFMDAQALPRGPLLLKNLGSDSLFRQNDYKGSRLRALLTRFPALTFLLVGDSGERDPEIYAALRAQHPERVAGIVIRKAKGSNLDPKRFDRMVVVDDYTDFAALVSLLRPAT